MNISWGDCHTRDAMRSTVHSGEGSRRCADSHRSVRVKALSNASDNGRLSRHIGVDHSSLDELRR